jgi:hypothetical protein
MTTSIDLSLQAIAKLADARAASERRKQRAAEIERMVVRRRRLRAEQTRRAQEGEERRSREVERRREQARLEGIREGAKQTAELEVRHRARLETLAAEERLARELCTLQPPPRRGAKAWLVIPTLVALAVVFATSPGALRPQSELAWIARGLASEAVADAAIDASDAAIASMMDQASDTPTPSAAVEPTAPAQLTAQRSAPRPVPRRAPTPAATHSCDDTIGDPCCAFGVIAC